MMKTSKQLLWLAGAMLFGALVGPVTASATFTAGLTAGYLYSTPYNSGNTSAGQLNSTATPNGALLLLIAAGTGNGQTFTSTPPAGQYVAGGDTILGASSFNAQVATGGTNNLGQATQNTFAGLASSTSPVYIELRWYPNITYQQYMNGATPTAGSYFGAYNPLVTNLSGNTTLNPDGGDVWSVPTGGTISLDFFTTDTGAAGAKQMPSEGYANFLVSAAGVPEPSAGILTGLGLAIVMSAVRVINRRTPAS